MSTNVQSKVSQIIEDVIMTSVDPDALLIESGLIDSLSAVDVTLAIEKEFGVKIPPSEIDLHLESMQTLVKYIEENQKK